MINTIIQTVSEFYGVSVEDMKGPRRFAEMVHARHVAMYILLKYTEMTQREVAKALGRSDHSSALHAREKIYDRIRIEPNIKEEINDLERRIEQIKRTHIRAQYQLARERAAA